MSRTHVCLSAKRIVTIPAAQVLMRNQALAGDAGNGEEVWCGRTWCGRTEMAPKLAQVSAARAAGAHCGCRAAARSVILLLLGATAGALAGIGARPRFGLMAALLGLAGIALGDLLLRFVGRLL